MVHITYTYYSEYTILIHVVNLLFALIYNIIIFSTLSNCHFIYVFNCFNGCMYRHSHYICIMWNFSTLMVLCSSKFRFVHIWILAHHPNRYLIKYSTHLTSLSPTTTIICSIQFFNVLPAIYQFLFFVDETFISSYFFFLYRLFWTRLLHTIVHHLTNRIYTQSKKHYYYYHCHHIFIGSVIIIIIVLTVLFDFFFLC